MGFIGRGHVMGGIGDVFGRVCRLRGGRYYLLLLISLVLVDRLVDMK